MLLPALSDEIIASWDLHSASVSQLCMSLRSSYWGIAVRVVQINSIEKFFLFICWESSISENKLSVIYCHYYAQTNGEDRNLQSKAWVKY